MTGDKAMSTINKERTKEQLIEELKASTQNARCMFEISEDTICALMSLLTNASPQLPQQAVVDNDKFRADFERWMVEDEKCIVGSSDPYPAGVESRNWRAWNACRAAMLQCSEPVTDNTNQQFESLSRGDK